MSTGQNTKYTIHASLEEVSKKNYDKKFTTVTTHKNVQNYYNEKCTYNVNVHTLQFAICIKSMELFEFYSKKKANFF